MHVCVCTAWGVWCIQYIASHFFNNYNTSQHNALHTSHDIIQLRPPTVRDGWLFRSNRYIGLHAGPVLHDYVLVIILVVVVIVVVLLIVIVIVVVVVVVPMVSLAVVVVAVVVVLVVVLVALLVVVVVASC